MKTIVPCSKSKGTESISGVYMIAHTKSKRRYIGSSAEVEKRVYHHIINLRRNKHHCQYLQRVWNKHKESEFVFRLLETCEVDQLFDLEQEYLDKSPPALLMNCHPNAGGSRGYKHTEVSRKKMSASAKRLITPEERQRRSERAKLQHQQGNLGQATWSDDVKARMKDVSSNLMYEHGAKGRKKAKIGQTTEEMSRRSKMRRMFDKS